MVKKDYEKRKEKKKIIRYRKGILSSGVLLTLSSLALIGFNLLLLYSATNSFLAFLIEELSLYVIVINYFLMFFVGFFGLFLALTVSNYRSFKRKINARQQIISSQVVARLEPEKELEKAILRFLTANEGKAFTCDSLISRIDQEGTSERLENVLSSLVGRNRINRTEKDKTQYYSVQ